MKILLLMQEERGFKLILKISFYGHSEAEKKIHIPDTCSVFPSSKKFWGMFCGKISLKNWKIQYGKKYMSIPRKRTEHGPQLGKSLKKTNSDLGKRSVTCKCELSIYEYVHTWMCMHLCMCICQCIWDKHTLSHLRLMWGEC